MMLHRIVYFLCLYQCHFIFISVYSLYSVSLLFFLHRIVYFLSMAFTPSLSLLIFLFSISIGMSIYHFLSIYILFQLFPYLYLHMSIFVSTYIYICMCICACIFVFTLRCIHVYSYKKNNERTRKHINSYVLLFFPSWFLWQFVRQEFHMYILGRQRKCIEAGV